MVGRQEERRAKVAGTCEITDGKFCKVGIRRGRNGATEYARRRENAGKRKCGKRNVIG